MSPFLNSRRDVQVCIDNCLTFVHFQTILGLFWRQFMQNGAEEESWKYLSVALPTACVAGPLGALLVSHCHRLVHATTCYTLDTIALVSKKLLIHES